jgi:hypothetical protein
MEMKKEMIAPCGINCAVCRAVSRPRSRCGGCLVPHDNMLTHCATCGIKFCAEHEKAEFTYCGDCGKFPCAKLKKLFKRYRENYKVDLMGNLLSIRENWMEKFIEIEERKWVCAGCGARLSMHRAECAGCGRGYR